MLKLYHLILHCANIITKIAKNICVTLLTVHVLNGNIWIEIALRKIKEKGEWLVDKREKNKSTDGCHGVIAKRHCSKRCMEL